eukprot:scaffold12743_cov18-Tisochrysis_lutea.AAC.2
MDVIARTWKEVHGIADHTCCCSCLHEEVSSEKEIFPPLELARGKVNNCGADWVETNVMYSAVSIFQGFQEFWEGNFGKGILGRGFWEGNFGNGILGRKLPPGTMVSFSKMLQHTIGAAGIWKHHD